MQPVSPVQEEDDTPSKRLECVFGGTFADRLFKAAQADLLTLYDRAQLLRQAHASNGLEIAFMNFQSNRIVTASCYVAPQTRPSWEGNDDP